ncbi:alpha-galactosidase [Streptomyces sp. NPDC051657]|uniref:alpha-galactosidase n=1 Tax=unclassified Streptomyces TaxID=2593676 RepID=UPI003418E34A
MRVITHHSAARLWLLCTPGTSYAFRLDADDVPRHVHWGRPLSLEQAVAVAADLPAEDPGGDDPGGEEYAVEGGLRFGAPSLTVRFPDGVRGFAWRFVSHAVEEGRLTLSFTDRVRCLSLDLNYRIRDGHDQIERWAVLTAGEQVDVLRLDSAAWTLPARDDYRVSHVVGEWGREFQLRRDIVPVGESVFTSRLGITGQHAGPWLMFDARDAAEEHGEVWSAALAWSGSRRITVRRDPYGRASWTGGFGHEGLVWKLAAGEHLETPVFTGLYAPDGFGGTSRRWHAYVEGEVLPARPAERPLIFNSWEATGFDIGEKQQRQLAGLAAGLGVEVFVVDDAWFGARTSDAAGLGDWWPNPDRFPNGLGPLADHVRALGMGFGLWAEPEAVNPDSDLFRSHPDWILSQDGRTRTQRRNQHVLNFARRDVREWAVEWLVRTVTELDVAFLKWDMNRPFSEAGQPGATDPDRVWIEHTRGVYEVMDRLRAARPGLYLESCAGGGGRADLGVLSRADQIWASDNTDAADRVAIQHGHSQLLPARTMGAWVTDSPNSHTARATSIRYRFHVSMAGALGIGGDLRNWSEEDLAWARMLVGQYKRIRPVVHGGVQYRLDHDAVQYVTRDEAVVFQFQPSALTRTTARTRLKGLDPDARYRNEDTGAVHEGAVLLSHGLLPLLPFDWTSELVHLRRLPR